MFKMIVPYTLALICIFTCIASAAFKLPDTGQTACYDTSGAVIACPGTGQDGAFNINALSYTDYGDTVTDNNTGLIWQKDGSTVTNNWYQASGTPDSTYNLSPLSVCDSLNTPPLGGITGWRLPTKKELMSIVDYAIPYPSLTISQTYFTNTLEPFYWSATSYAFSPSSAWGVRFDGGFVDFTSKSSGLYYSNPIAVRCVSGGQSPQNFVNNNDGTVTDSNTGLIWQKTGSVGTMTWGSALLYCAASTVAGLNWRLPDIKELASLTDDTRYAPAIDPLFLGVPSDYTSYYWSSTTYVSTPSEAWIVAFYDGNLSHDSKNSSYYVRCVHGGQPVPLGTAWIVGTGSYFNTLQGAHDGAVAGNTIEAEAIVFPESLTISEPLTLLGGFDGSFAGNGGFTTLGEVLLIRSGSLTVDNLIIK